MYVLLKHQEVANLIIVDDDEDILFVLQYWFEMSGFHPYVFQQPGIMYEALHEVQPDLVLLDVNLEIDDGRDVCRKLRSGHLLKCPVILFSANPYNLQSYRDYGANATINKPFDLPDITNLVNSLLVL
jgi:DNA-binding response OmpR family regulator